MMVLKIKKGAAAITEPGNGPSLENIPTPTTRVRPLVPPRAPSSAKNKTRVLLNVLDGKIEWDKMTPESRKAFEDLFRDPEFLSQFGLSGKEKMFDPEQIKQLYDGISIMYRTVVGFFLRWPEGALKLLGYTDEQKNMLAEPTANLANKFAPAFLVKHQELIIWFSMFGVITQKNFMEAAAEAKKLMAKPQSQPHLVPRPAVAPVVVSPPPAHRAPAPAEQPAPTIEVPFSMPSPSSSEFAGESLEQ